VNALPFYAVLKGSLSGIMSCNYASFCVCIQSTIAHLHAFVPAFSCSCAALAVMSRGMRPEIPQHTPAGLAALMQVRQCCGQLPARLVRALGISWELGCWAWSNGVRNILAPGL
jgi:hypothetical protein